MQEARINEKPSLTVVILTYNEELHIERAIRSISMIARQVIVVDSFSTDRTLEIAQTFDVSVFQNKFVNQAQQFQWAMEHCPIKSDWVLRLDADEYLEDKLVAEVAARLPYIGENVTGIYLRRKQIFMGRWIKHGDRYPLNLLRLFRVGKGRVEQRWMDEHIVVDSGDTVIFRYDFADANLHNISWWIDKHNKYATREAIEVLLGKYDLLQDDAATVRNALLSQTWFKRIIKETIYNRMPLFWGSTLYFLYRYIICLGFLDGKEGAAYHFMQGFWYRFLVEIKLLELDRELYKLNDKESRLQRLEELTGYSLQSKRVKKGKVGD
jgi:glycosyltransferase involved in cell wall biosynthesis